jgi:hypothetical protein
VASCRQWEGLLFPKFCFHDTIAVRVVQGTVAQYRRQDGPALISLQSACIPLATHWGEKTWQQFLDSLSGEVHGSWKGMLYILE